MEGLAKLGFSVPTLIAQLINFGIILILMRVFAFKPILRMMDERSNKIKRSLEDAERIKEQAAIADKETAKRIEEATQEGRRLVEQAMHTGAQAAHEEELKARKEAEELIAQAHATIGQERDRAIAELRKEFADLTILAAEKVIKRSLDKKAHRELIEQILDSNTELKLS
jgi:F-type H+-transporting ATPase subunit b